VGFVSVVLIAVVLVPFLVNERMNRIREENVDYSEPATRLSEEALTGVISEFTDLMAFQAGDSQLHGYPKDTAKVDTAIAQLQPLVSALRPETLQAYMRLRNVIAAWHREVNTSGFLSGNLSRQTLRKVLLQHNDVISAVREALESFQAELDAGAAERRARITEAQRLNVVLTIILSLSALIALGIVAGLAWRLHAALGAAQAGRREAQQATQARDEILRIVSHDLRNPMNVVSMASRQVADRKLTSQEIQHFTQIIQRSIGRMNGLIQALLDVGKMEAGRPLALQREHHSARSIAEEAYEFSQFAAARKSIDFACDVENCGVTVYADRQRLLQVLSNLIDNAIKFTPEGGRIRLTCKAGKGTVRFAVSDTGVGIAEEDRPRIFQIYWQAEKTSHAGTGLGLAIVKRIVEEHGGRIWVESQPGLGSTFSFTLPSNEPAAEVGKAS
jgi:signal transduction histidine kinase